MPDGPKVSSAAEPRPYAGCPQNLQFKLMLKADVRLGGTDRYTRSSSRLNCLLPCGRKREPMSLLTAFTLEKAICFMALCCWQVSEATSSIKLDSTELEISNAEFRTASGEKIPAKEVVIIADRVLFKFEQTLAIGKFACAREVGHRYGRWVIFCSRFCVCSERKKTTV